MALVYHSHTIGIRLSSIGNDKEITVHFAVPAHTQCQSPIAIFKGIVPVGVAKRFIGNDLRVLLDAILKQVIFNDVVPIRSGIVTDPDANGFAAISTHITTP